MDTTVVEALGSDPQAIVTRLEAEITPTERQVWTAGDVKAWALDSYQVAKTTAYSLGTLAGCGTEAAPISLPQAYQTASEAAARLQLEKAGVRLAFVLNAALAG